MLDKCFHFSKKIIKNYKKIPSKIYSIILQMKESIDADVYFKKIIARPLRGELKNYKITSEVKKLVEYLPKHHSLDYVLNEIANFLLNIGLPYAARPFYQHSLEINPSPDTYSLYLQCLLMDPTCNDEMMYKEASRYNNFFSSIKKTKEYLNTIDTKRKLNIAYICHFFHNSVSQSLLVPFLKAHNPERVNIFCYSDTDTHEVDPAIKSIAHIWRDTKNLNHEAFSAQIKEDKIDILLELNGHCLTNRYEVIARRPAPIQISFYNQCGTTGITDFDYALVGNEYDLLKSKNYYSESIYYVNGVAGVAIFPDYFPPVSPPPCLSKGYITFGSFGAAHKVNIEVVKLWCKVLKKVPHSKFLMKAGVLSHEAYIKVYKRWFKKEGIDLNRIHFAGHSKHVKMLEAYSQVDIALDTFPYAAGTTTMEAFWQGVPVITLAGDKFCSQNGKAIASSIGHSELIAYTEEEYVNKAIALANDIERLKSYRQNLRNDFKQSPRADAKAFAEKLEDAYFDMWGKYCEGMECLL